MAPSQGQSVASRPCAYCGKPVPTRMNRCPYCREEVTQVRLSSPLGRNGRREIRRGLMYMLLGAVIYYFVGGYSGLSLPFTLSPWVITYLAPVVFLADWECVFTGFFCGCDRKGGKFPSSQENALSCANPWKFSRLANL